MIALLVSAAFMANAGATVPPDQTISVFAAASLRDAFMTIAQRYESSHPGTRVLLNFAGSQTLAAQINNGARADVFASASMTNLTDAHPQMDTIRVFAHNRLTIVARKGLGTVRTARDLPSARKIVLADRSVPAGRYALAFLNLAARSYGKAWLGSVNSHVVSHELDVRAVLAKVRLGEADAGIVYVSDAVSAHGQVQVVPIPETLNQLAKYPVAQTTRPANTDGGRDFVKFLFTNESQSIFERNGFTSPIRPVVSLTIISGSNTRSVKLPLSSSLGKETISVTGHSGVPEPATGVPIFALLKGHKGQVRIVAADEYAKTFNSSELAKGKAVLIREPDGNYQIKVAGRQPDSWLRWIRRIELK